MYDVNYLNKQLRKFLNEEELNCIDPMAMIEMCPVIATSENKNHIKNISISLDADRNFYGIEYFKIYNNKSIKASTKMNRIRFREPKYEPHSGSNWILNSKEKKDLIELLNASCEKTSGVKNNWQYAIRQFNMEAYPDYKTEADLIITIEQQNKLDNKDPRKYYLPIDLPMPNYMELKNEF